MRTLFLTHDYSFPVSSGAHVYTGNVVRGLVSAGIHVDVFCFRANLQQSTTSRESGAFWRCFPRPQRSRLAQVTSRFPAVVIRNSSAEMRAALRECLSQTTFDVIIFDCLVMGWILDLLKELNIRGPQSTAPLLIYMSHNVETDLQQQIANNYPGGMLLRMLAKQDARKSTRLEARLLAETDYTTVETEEDGFRFQELLPSVNTILVQPGYDGKYLESRLIDSHCPRTVAVLGGRVSGMKQIVLDSFLEHAASGLEQHGLATHVIGPMTDAYQAKCQSNYPSVKFHGFVQDVLPLLSQMRMGVVADHVGGGFKHRILTYVFHRIPIVATPEAMAGLPLEPGTDYIPIRSYAEVPRACNEHADNFDLLNQLQERSYQKCRDVFSWQRTSEKFAGQLQKLVMSSTATKISSHEEVAS